MQIPLFTALGNIANIPRFFVWRLTDWTGKKFDTKLPWTGTGSFDARAACLGNQLMSLADAVAHLNSCNANAQAHERFSLGWYVMPDAGYWFLDIDNAVTWDAAGAPTFNATAAQAWNHLSPHGVFFEYSSSGHGMHFVGRGALPPHMTTGSKLPAGVELYSKERGICFGMSGYAMGNADAQAMPPAEWIVAPLTLSEATGKRLEHWRGTEDDDELIQQMLREKQGGKLLLGQATIQQLWAGDISNTAGASEADAALAAKLAWWTGNDAPRMQRLMFRSGLVREKWTSDSHRNYIPTTIRNACALNGANCYVRPAPRLAPLLPVLPSPAPAESAADPLANIYAAAPAEPNAQHRGSAAAMDLITRAGNSDELKENAKRIAAMGPWDAADMETLAQRLKRKSAELNSSWPLPLCRKLICGGITDAMDELGVPDWLDDWAFIATQNKYCHIAADFDCMGRDALMVSLYNKPEIPTKANGEKEDAQKMLNMWGVQVVSDMGYRPTTQDLTYREHGRVLLNKFCNSMPTPEAGGDPAAIQIYMRHLWNVADQHQENYEYLLRFLGHIAQRPGVLIRWALLMIGAHGTGKTMMAAPLMAAIGSRNVKLGSSRGVNNGGGFMDWVASEQMLGVISDFGVSGMEKYATVDAIKPVISDDRVSITRKGKTDIVYTNYASYIFSSNQREPLPMSPTERRYFVLTTTWLDALTSDPTRKAESDAYYAELKRAVDALTPGQWLTFFQSIPVGDLPAVAPKTGAFAAIVGNSISEAAQALRECVDGFDIVTTNKLTDALRGIDGAPSRKALSKAMNDLGFDYYAKQRLTLHGIKVGIYARSAKVALATVDWEWLKTQAIEFNRIKDTQMFANPHPA